MGGGAGKIQKINAREGEKKSCKEARKKIPSTENCTEAENFRTMT